MTLINELLSTLTRSFALSDITATTLTLENPQESIQPLVRLAGYRQPVLDLVIFDRSLRVRPENAVHLTGINP